MRSHTPAAAAVTPPGPARLRELRKEKNYTQDALCRKIGAAAGYIAHLEAGRWKPSARYLLRLAAALECDPAELITAELVTVAPLAS